MPSAFDDLLADKRRAVALFDDSVADGALTKQQLAEQGTVTVKTRSGRSVVLTYDAKKKRPFADGAQLEREVVETSAGTMFVKNRVVLPQ